MAQTEAESALNDLRGKLLAKLAKAKQRTELANAGCGQGQTRKPSTRLKQVRRRLIGYAHQLRSLATRHAVPAAFREPLAQSAAAISTDAETLRKALRCPDDASRP